jgi:protein-disulfide isomerase
MRALMRIQYALGWMTVAVALVVGAGCSKQKASTTPVVTAPSGSCMAPDTVVAIVGENRKITAEDLDTYANVHQTRKEKLEEMINDEVIKAEAQKRNMTPQQFMQGELDPTKMPQPSDDEIKGMFEKLKGRQIPPDAKFEDFKPRIAQFLNSQKQQQKAQELVEKLKSDAKVQVLLPEPRRKVEAKGPARGPENAPVTIVEFSDFQCPFCSKAHDTVEEVMQAYAGKVRLYFRHYPLPNHPQAPKAAEAAMCANEQGKFWEYHDALFKNQRALEPTQLKEYATSVGLDAAKFTECLDSGKHAAAVQEDMQAGSRSGVQGTPAFFINGIFLNGAQPLSEFKRIIDAELATN